MESSTPTSAAEQRAAALRLRILAEKPAADVIARVVAQLPDDVQEQVANRIIFVWPTRDDSSSFVLPLGADAAGDRLVVCLNPCVADHIVHSQANVIAFEIARAFISPPSRTDEPRTGRMDREVSEQIQKLVNSWAVA